MIFSKVQLSVIIGVLLLANVVLAIALSRSVDIGEFADRIDRLEMLAHPAPPASKGE